MNNKPGESISLWRTTCAPKTYNTLNHDAEIETCIVGGGITGLTTAYLLCKEGRKVMVVEDGSIGSGETGNTTAHITNALDDRYYKCEQMHGEQVTRLVADSETSAIKKLSEIINNEKIDCDFEYVNGYLFFPEHKLSDVQTEYEATRRAGVDVQIVNQAPLNFYGTYPCLKFPNQAQFHSLKYLNGLCDAIEKLGGIIFTGTHVSSIDKKDGKVILTTSDNRKITCFNAVMATNSPISDKVKIYLKEYAYRTYVVGYKIPKGSVPKGLYWDDLDPYHYVRIHPHDGTHDVLIVGGEDHKTGSESGYEKHLEEKFQNLHQWTKERFKNIGNIDFKWSGQVMEPADYLSLTGLEPETDHNIYIATGDSGMGITHGTFSAMILSDLICGKSNPWAKIYDPSRVTLSMSSVGEMIAQNFDMAAHLTDYITPGEVSDPEKILQDEGAVIRDGLNKVAVYKDNEGKLHMFSALCTHLKCIVRWNNVEKSWDCPCHGSRFDKFGKVLNGPATHELRPYKKS